MAFVGGPRQVGKTNLALQFLKPPSARNKGYLNWDRAVDKSFILRDQLPLTEKTLIWDEIHKTKNWRNLLKELFDKYLAFWFSQSSGS